MIGIWSQLTRVCSIAWLFLIIFLFWRCRHPECIHSKENRDTVFCQMRRAMDLIHYVIKDGILAASQNDHRRNRLQQSTMDWDTERGTASSCLRVFARLMESSRPRFSASGTSILSTSKPTLKDISSTGIWTNNAPRHTWHDIHLSFRVGHAAAAVLTSILLFTMLILCLFVGRCSTWHRHTAWQFAARRTWIDA